MTSNAFVQFCPYLCGHESTVDASKAGYQMIECPKCGKPWVLETVYMPQLVARKVEDIPMSRSEEKWTCVYCGKKYYPHQMISKEMCFDCFERGAQYDDPLPPPEPDIIEQIKAGEHRLRQLYPCLRPFFMMDDKMSRDEKEYISLQKHLVELMEQLTHADDVEMHLDDVSVWYIVTYENAGNKEVTP